MENEIKKNDMWYCEVNGHMDRLPDRGPLYTVRQQQLFEIVAAAKHVNLVCVKSGIAL